MKWFALLLVLALPVHAAELLNWDVESGTIQSKFTYGGVGVVSITTAKAHSGTRSLFYNRNHGDATDSPALVFSTRQEIVVEFWWWLPSALEGGEAGQHTFRIGKQMGDSYIGAGQIDTVMRAPGASAFRIETFAVPPGGQSAQIDESVYNQFNLGALPTNQWFKIRLYAKMSTSAPNGILQVWVNDALKFANLAVQYQRAGSPFVGFDVFLPFTNFDNATDVGSQWWMDDIKVWDALPDVIILPLLPPLNLRVL